MVEYLISNNLAIYVRVVDKVPPQVAWLSQKHQVYYNDSRVEFKSANLINQGKNDFSVWLKTIIVSNRALGGFVFDKITLKYL